MNLRKKQVDCKHYTAVTRMTPGRIDTFGGFWFSADPPNTYTCLACGKKLKERIVKGED